MVKISPFGYAVIYWAEAQIPDSNIKALFNGSMEEVLETNAQKTKYIQQQYQQMHTSILKLVCIHNDLIHVSDGYIKETCRSLCI